MAGAQTKSTLPTFPFDSPAGHDTDPEGLRLLDEGPVVRARMAETGQEFWLVLGYHANRQVMADPRFIREPVTRPGTPVTIPALVGVTDSISAMDAPRHARVRRLLAAAFTHRMINRLRPRIQAVIDDLLDGLDDHEQPADLMEVFLAPLPVTVICELLGVPESDRGNLRGWAHRFMDSTALPEESAAIHQEVGAYMAGLIAAKRAHPGDDLTTALVEVRDEGDRLTETELVINIQTLLVAGHETTLNQLANNIVTLSRNPDQFDLLRRNPELADNAVEELLRYDKLVRSTIPWVATADVEVQGHLISAGDAVIGMPHIANRDPEVFIDPNRLDITRSNAAQHLGFIHGPHFCLGAQLARTELRMALASLVRRYPNLDVAVPHSDLEWKQENLTRAMRRLPVTW